MIWRSKSWRNNLLNEQHVAVSDIKSMRNHTKKPSGGIKAWPEGDRPREKLLKNGEHTLSNTELLAILLRTGVKGKSALELARSVLQKFKTLRNMSHTDAALWKDCKGLGSAKIAQIRAALELGRRFKEEEIKEDRPKIGGSKDVTEILLPRMRDLKKEVFKAVLLNAQNRIVEIVEVTEGTVNEAYPVIRELFQKALQYFAVSLICVHNHPSGNPQPSQEDRTFTRELVQAGNILQIKVLDHIIIGDDRYYSFADEKEL